MKIVTAREAVDLIKDGDTVATGGGVGIGFPELLVKTMGASGVRDLTLVHAAGQGDGKGRGLDHLATPGMLKRVIGGHWGLTPKIQRLIRENEIEACNIPQGTMSLLYRDIAAHRPGHITKIGMSTYVDPLHGGGRMNARTHGNIVKRITTNGGLNGICLFYPTFPINVALIRVTSSDRRGNLSMEQEALTMDTLSIAMAAKNSGGIVIAQVKQVVKNVPAEVKVPGIFVDYVVICDNDEDHPQTFGTIYNPAFCAREWSRNTVPSSNPIALRAAKEVKTGQVLNFGIGLSMEIPPHIAAKDMLDQVTMTNESGAVGGVMASGLDFGASVMAQAIIDQPYQFDFYDGGGIDVAFLGFAEIDRSGNVNVSKFGGRIVGCGGFIDITQRAKKLVFVGTYRTSDGKTKFVDKVEQVTFRGSPHDTREILCITDNGVFDLSRGKCEEIK